LLVMGSLRHAVYIGTIAMRTRLSTSKNGLDHTSITGVVKKQPRLAIFQARQSKKSK
jgi:hypothetical protein